MISIKEEARKLVETLPDDATWEDLMYEIYVREKVELGLKAIDDGKTYTIDEARKRLLS
jgi:hypothetical protein